MSGLVCPEGYFPGDLAGESKCRPCNIICRKGSNLSDERLCQTFKTCKGEQSLVLPFYVDHTNVLIDNDMN